MIVTHRHSGKGFQSALRLSGMTVLGILVLLTPLRAEDIKKDEPKKEEAKKENDKSYLFAPDFCDFEITFPEKPNIAQKCVPGAECYDLNSYTMVYDLQTTVDISVTCNPSTPADYKRYNDQVMKAALAGMVEDRNLSTHETNFKQYGTTKSASITGTGVTGTQDKIYTAQLWIGPNSVFTIQAELIGAAHPVADKSFGDILRSIKTKEGKQVSKEDREKRKDNEDEEETDRPKPKKTYSPTIPKPTQE